MERLSIRDLHRLMGVGYDMFYKIRDRLDIPKSRVSGRISYIKEDVLAWLEIEEVREKIALLVKENQRSVTPTGSALHFELASQFIQGKFGTAQQLANQKTAIARARILKPITHRVSAAGDESHI